MNHYYAVVYIYQYDSYNLEGARVYNRQHVLRCTMYVCILENLRLEAILTSPCSSHLTQEVTPFMAIGNVAFSHYVKYIGQYDQIIYIYVFVCMYQVNNISDDSLIYVTNDIVTYIVVNLKSLLI